MSKLLPLHTKHSFPILSKNEIDSIIRKIGKNVNVIESYREGKHTVFFLPQATSDILHITDYGRRSPKNHKEQKLQGLGIFFQDEQGYINVVVSHALEIPTRNRSAVSAATLEKDGSWNPGLDFLDYYRSEYIEHERLYNIDEHGNIVNPFLGYGNSEYAINIHTHPDIGTFFSTPDRNNAKARASYAPIVSMVIDPVRREVLAGVGQNLEDAEIRFYNYNYADSKEKEEDPVKMALFLLDGCLRKKGCKGKTTCRKRSGRTEITLRMMLPKEIE